jgi:hypothetical protein
MAQLEITDPPPSQDPSPPLALALPHLSAAHRISASQYHSLLQTGSRHVLLDVRSRLQFEMLSLPLEQYAPPPSDPSASPSATFTCLNLPYPALCPTSSPGPKARDEATALAKTLLEAAETSECPPSLPRPLTRPSQTRAESVVCRSMCSAGGVTTLFERRQRCWFAIRQ